MTSEYKSLTPNFNARRPQMLILHGTEVDWAKTEAILRGKTDREASCHYAISQKGEVVQYLDENVRAWHAGQSWWGGLTDLNSISLGIELELVCPDGSFAHANNKYSDVQMEACIKLCHEILGRHKIPQHLVLAHQDVAPYRRFDPGVTFDWALLAKNNIGAWHGLAPTADDKIVTDAQRLAEFHLKLAVYGYDPRPNAEKNDFSMVVRAFQTHFLPWKICGDITEQTIVALDNLLRLRNA